MAISEKRITRIEVILGIVGVPLLAWVAWVSTTLFSINGDIRAVRQKIKDGGLGEIVSKIQNPSSPQQLAATLDVVSSLINARRVENQKPDEKKLGELSAAVKVAAQNNPGIPTVWQAAYQLVDYRSQNTVGQIPNDSANCLLFDVALIELKNTSDDLARTYFSQKKKLRYVASNCTLNLDDDGSYARTAAWQFFDELHRRYPGHGNYLHIKNARIVYSGGPMIPVNGILFENCIFDLKSPFSIPPKAGQSIATQLLTANLNKAEIMLPAG